MIARLALLQNLKAWVCDIVAKIDSAYLGIFWGILQRENLKGQDLTSK